MGQQISHRMPYNQDMKQLRMIDEREGLYLNVCNQRTYIKNNILVRSVAEGEHQLQTFRFRRLNDSFVVSVDYCKTEIDSIKCSSLPSFSYFIQKQEYSLFDKLQFKVKEGLSLLVHVLKGFQKLYERFGYFTPSPKLIFFNRNHEPKVWFSQDLRVTTNVRNCHYPRSLLQENNLVREIVKVFDSLRDPNNPMFCYSKCLSRQYLTFKTGIDTFMRKQVEINQTQRKVLSPPIQRVERLVSPVFRPTFVQQNVTRNISSLVSPRFTNRQQPVLHPRLKINYCSPVKMTESEDMGRFRDSINVSLKHSGSNPLLTRRLNPSNQFTSTMPNSLRNSRIEDKNVCVEVLTPVLSSNDSAVPLQSKRIIKKQLNARFSDVEPTSFGRDLSNLQRSHNPQVNTNTSRQKQSLVQIDSFPFEESNSQSSTNKQEAFPEGGVKRQFQTHKRHQTDYKIAQKVSDLSDNQKSSIGMTVGGKFLCNTIKSIHLLEEDKDVDSSIITDLKQIINKYKLTARHL